METDLIFSEKKDIFMLRIDVVERAEAGELNRLTSRLIHSNVSYVRLITVHMHNEAYTQPVKFVLIWICTSCCE